MCYLSLPCFALFSCCILLPLQHSYLHTHPPSTHVCLCCILPTILSLPTSADFVLKLHIRTPSHLRYARLSTPIPPHPCHLYFSTQILRQSLRGSPGSSHCNHVAAPSPPHAALTRRRHNIFAPPPTARATFVAAAPVLVAALFVASQPHFRCSTYARYHTLDAVPALAAAPQLTSPLLATAFSPQHLHSSQHTRSP